MKGLVHWSTDGWRTVADVKSRDTGLGVHAIDLNTNRLPASSEIAFTFYWPRENRWEGVNYTVVVE